MKWYEILITIAATAFVAFIIIFNFANRKKGKSSCSCGGSSQKGCSSGCGGCPFADKCQSNDKDK
ncbi:MAG TPA: hypothetical protein PKY53_04490 [Clostridia bacterium]|nr:hypothetical protein [Clostridia bacterium]